MLSSGFSPEMHVLTPAKTENRSSPKALETTLNLSLIGHFNVHVDNNRLPIKSKKGQAILAYLALSPDGIASRERLRQLLWASSPVSRAQSSLRHALWKISHTLESSAGDILRCSRVDVALDVSRVKVDSEEILAALEAGVAHDKLRQEPHLFEQLLQDFDQCSEEYYHWACAKRAEYQRRLIPGLHHAVARNATNPELQLALFELITQLDPLNEPAVRSLMRGKTQQGDTAGALLAYQRLCQDMEKLQGMEPNEKTQTLAVDVKTGEIPIKEPEEARLNHKPTVTLQVTDSSGLKTEHIPLLVGFQFELLASLIRFREWRVNDATQTPAQLGGTKADNFELNITPITCGESLRLIVTLKDAGSGAYLWSERVEHSERNWLDSQAQLVRQLAHSLNVQVSEQRLQQLANRDSFSLSVYDAWLKTEALLRSYKHEAWEEAREILRHLSHSDRNFSRAYASLAQIDNAKHLVFPGMKSNPERRQRALSYARRSVELDPHDTRNQLSLGWAYAMKGQHTPSSRAFSQAFTLNPSDPWTATSVALGQAFGGDVEAALILSQQILKIDCNPTPTHWAYHSAISFLAEKYSLCIAYAQLAEGSMTDVLAWQSAAYAITGDHRRASSTLQRFLAETRRNWHAPQVASEAEIADWILTCFPIKQRETWDRLRQALTLAGLDTQGVDAPVGCVRAPKIQND